VCVLFGALCPPGIGLGDPLIDCIEQLLNVSTPCAQCYVDLSNCAAPVCGAECVPPGGSPSSCACQQCGIDNCGADFETCAGFLSGETPTCECPGPECNSTPCTP
jgi:hypothetical protein